MMKRLSLLLVLICFCTVLVSPFTHAGEDAPGYQLSLERPEAYGNYYAFKTEADRSVHTIESRDGQTQSEENNTIEAKLAGRAWVSDANPDGQIVEVVIYPDEFSGKRNGKEVTLTIGERLFVQMQDGEFKVFSSAGHLMKPEVVEVLGTLLAFMVASDESELSKNDMFALDPPRKPGQSWKGNPDAIAKSLNQSWDILAEPKQVQGSMTFNKLDKLFEEDAAKLDIEIKLKGFTVPALTKRGLSIDKSAGSVKVQRMLPIKKASLNGKVIKQVDWSVTASGDVPDRGKVQVQRTTKLKTQAEYQIIE